MTEDDVLFGYRLQLFDLAARTTVSHACRTFGVHRSTYYRWKRSVDRQGLEMLGAGSAAGRRCATRRR
jgi:transposase-like protein